MATSFMKPIKFWQKTKRVEQDVLDEKIAEIPLPRKRDSNVVPLVESNKTEVYKLSRVDEGLYMPPSPTLEGKRDHWIDVNEDIMEFNLPGSECLTTRSSETHHFFTPSSFVQSQPYILSHMSSISLSSDDDD